MANTGIITFHCADNFGAVLQVYALQEMLKSMGVDSEIIDFRPDMLIVPYDDKVHWQKLLRDRGFLGALRRFLRLTISKKDVSKRKQLFDEFRRAHLRLSKAQYWTPEELRQSPPEYEYYITGSDQVWGPGFLRDLDFNASYFLDFAPSESTKIAYAASIAEEVDKSLWPIYEGNLKRFDYISIREKEFLPFIQQFTDKPVWVTLDPTLLLGKKEWKRVEKQPNIDGRYVLVYDLQLNEEIVLLSERIVRETGYKVVSWSNPRRFSGGIRSFEYEGPAEFLGYVNNADFILTTSFHGVVFSVLYNKPFYTIPHTTRGSRMVDLLTSLELTDRIVYASDDLSTIDYEVDFEKPLQLLERRKAESLGFLAEALDIQGDERDY